MGNRYADRLAGMGRRPYRFWLDLETTGLQTKSYQWGTNPKLTEYGPAVSELAFGGVGKRTRVRGYTNVLSGELLQRHGITIDVLRKHGALPASAIQELIQDGPNRWDPSVGEDGVLSGVFRRHARHVLKNRPTSNLADLVSGMLGKIEHRIGKGGPVEVLGWNISGFDIPTLHGQLRLLAHQTGNEGLLRRFEGTMSKVKIKEASELYHTLLFDRMLKTNFTPVISDRAMMNAAALQGIKSFADVKQARKAGALTDHTMLRTFMDDVRLHVSGKEGFARRAETWAAQYMGTAQAKIVGQAMQEAMRDVGPNLASFHHVARQIIANRAVPLGNGISMSSFDILNQMYRQPGQRHMNILTSPDLLGLQSDTPVTAFAFAGGGKQEQVGRSFVQAAKGSGWQTQRVAKLERRLMRGHVAEGDRQAVSLLYSLMERAPESIKNRMSDIHLNLENAEKLGLQRVNETMMDIVQRQSRARAVQSTARGAEEKLFAEGLNLTAREARTASRTALAENIPKMVGPGGNMWLKAGLVLAGLTFLSERNKPRPPIQGLRDPNSTYRQVEGLNPSEMPGANQSWFFSGYHSWESMSMTASYLGKPWTNKYYNKQKNDNAALMGDVIHAATEAELEAAGIATGGEVQLYGQGMQGRLDVMLRGGIPLELKTIADDAALSMLRAPRQKDIGQANYDAVVTNSPYAYIMYMSREDPTKRRLFRQYRDPSLLAQQQSALGAQISRTGGVPSYAYPSWLGERLKNLVMETMYNLRLYGRPQEFDGDDPFAGYGGGDYVPMFGPSAVPNDITDGCGYAGLPSLLFENANKSKIRDQAVQLSRIPGAPKTYRGRLAMNHVGHCEMSAFQGM